MTKSNDSKDDDFWDEKPELTEYIEKATGEDASTFKKTASISNDGEQYFVRFPKTIEEVKNLENHKVEFTGIEKPPEKGENKIVMKLVEKDG